MDISKKAKTPKKKWIKAESSKPVTKEISRKNNEKMEKRVRNIRQNILNRILKMICKKQIFALIEQNENLLSFHIQHVV